MEITANMVDRLVTVEIRWGGRGDRGVIPRLYDCAREKSGGKPLSLLVAQRMIDTIKPGDNVFLVTGWACLPFLPHGETDGPLGIASLARAIRIGLNALPIIVVGSRQVDPTCKTVEAAEVIVVDYEDVKSISGATAAAVTFPTFGKKGGNESRKFAEDIIAKYAPRAVISVETPGPNEKGVKHTSTGHNIEANGDQLPGLEHLFYEASARKIFTAAIVDGGNEIGSGTIQECVRQVLPYANTCQCPCGSGITSAVKTDIVFPVAVSNWGAYGVSAMIAYLLQKPEILHDAHIEHRMLEANIRTGAFDAHSGRPCMFVDGIDYLANEAVLTILNKIIESALKGQKVERFAQR